MAKHGAWWVVVVGMSLVAGCYVRTEPAVDAGALDAPVLFPDVPIVLPDAGMCPVSEINCSGHCTRVVADSNNCGSCGNVCPAGTSCALGECGCIAPMLGCGGLCIDPATDRNNCGVCGKVCGSAETCTAGECVCTDPSLGQCYDVAAGRDVCVDLQTDPMNCGTCGNECTGEANACIGGVCTCPSGLPACDGVCLDLLTDDANCGTCGTTCLAPTTCAGGFCTCPGGGVVCAEGCTDIMTDPLNCGACLTSCGADGACSGGVCTACGTGLTRCGSPSRCVNTATSRLHCGACGRACGAGEACVGGLCECMAPLADCGAGCTDFQTDERNCGGCGIDCGVGGLCSAGVCTCAAPYTLCGASCHILDTDVAHCGACDDPCPPLVGGVCAGGVCGCPAGQTDCGGTCVNTTSSATNCGSCGNVCPPTFVCLMSTCTDAPPTRYRQETPPAGTVTFVDACAAPGHTTVLPSVDDSEVATTLPFAFRYWATDLAAGASVHVASNGYITMDGSAAWSLSGTVPSTTTPNAVIAPMWGDLVTNAAGVCIATLGTAGSRQWVVEWAGVRYFGDSSANLTFEIILDEDSRTIDLVYGTMSATSGRTVGIEDPTGAMGINACPSGTGQCLPATGTVIRFTPIP